jgi:hypothetical protein
VMTAIDKVSEVFRRGLNRLALTLDHAEAWPGSETSGLQCLSLSEFAGPPASPAPPAPLSWRLDRLARAAQTSRQIAREYLRAAASMAAAARSARTFRSPELSEARLAAARDSQLRARKSLAFAALCRRRAARLSGEPDGADSS